MGGQIRYSARSTSVPRSRARGIPVATGSIALGSPPAAVSRQCCNTSADGESCIHKPCDPDNPCYQVVYHIQRRFASVQNRNLPEPGRKRDFLIIESRPPL